MKKEKGILEYKQYLDPRYDFLDDYAIKAFKGFWTPARYEKLINEVDAPYYHFKMGEVEKSVVERTILAISMVEDKVKSYWSVLHKEIPQTVVSDVGALFGMIETVHRRAYHSLGKEIGIDVTNIDKYQPLRDRLKYLNKHSNRDPKITGRKNILKKLVLFTALVERCSLFTQFYILMSFKNSSKGLPTISSLQTTTMSEEILHYSFGIDLINIIKKEYPELWEEHLIELVNKSLKEAYKAELNLIEWFFEKGVPEHLTREEVVNFLGYNFNVVCKDLGLEMRFDCDYNMYDEINSWALVQVHSREPDFFDNSVGGYSAEDIEIDIEGFKF